MTASELEQCISAYGTEIYSFCLQITGSRARADELYQDTFLTALEQLEKIRPDQNPRSYLLSVAIRLNRNRKRKFARRQRIAPAEHLTEEKRDTIADARNNPEEQFLLAEERRMIRQEVLNLDEKYRLPVCLYYMEELSIREIAQILEIPEGTVKSRLNTARSMLCERLSLSDE